MILAIGRNDGGISEGPFFFSRLEVTFNLPATGKALVIQMFLLKMAGRSFICISSRHLKLSFGSLTLTIGVYCLKVHHCKWNAGKAPFINSCETQL